MQSTIFNTPVIKIDSLKTKFDTLVLSNSFVTLIGDYVEALFFHQLHYWSYSEYGVIIDGTRWIYKPLREWLSEVFTFLTEWKLRKAIALLLEKGLIERKKLYVKHHEIKHDNPYWNPKNQTYYYSVNYNELQKRIDEVEKAETIENVRIEDFTELSSEEIKDTKFCDCSQYSTKNTSIENSSKDLSHPHLPCVGEVKKGSNQEKEVHSINRSLLEIQEAISATPKAITKDTNVGRVEQNINQDKCTSKQSVQESVQVEVEQTVVKPQLKTPKGTKPNRKRRNEAPWKDEGQFKRFYRALIQALPIVANARSPQGLAQVIIRQLRSGTPHSYWDDFAAGLPIGASTKPEWEIEPGVPYPMFIEYLTEKIIKGNNTQSNEQARNEVFRILSQPRQATAFWGQFKRSVVNVSEQVERDRALGVSTPNTPVWTRERIEPSVEEAAEAGQKIMAAGSATQAVIEGAKTAQLEGKSEPPTPDPWNEGDLHQPSTLDSQTNDKPQLSMREMLAERRVKGFCKPMPKVSRKEAEAEAKAESEAIARTQMNHKTHLSQMSLDEINELVKDPIFRTQLAPQLIDSNYELITDYLGQIIGVKAPPPSEE